MKNFAIFLLVFIFGSPVAAAQNLYPEEIKNFSVEITLNKDSSFLVKESIVYDFGENLKHGIYRDIQIKEIKIKVIKVVDEFGNPYIFKVSKTNNSLRIKIGDPDKEIKGERLYNIFYTVQRGLSYFANYDELYWNVTGNDWQVPIKKAGAKIHLPAGVPEKEIKLACFTGFLGSQGKDCGIYLDKNGDINFESEKVFSPKEGLTIVLGLPKGIIKEPDIFQEILWRIEGFFPLLIPLLVFLYLLREWWIKGKDPKVKKTIIAQYEPPANLRPAEVSLVMRQKITPQDISATIIDLAVRGYIKIKEIKKTGLFACLDYELIKLKDFNDPKADLREYEKELLFTIFEFEENKSLSGLENKFYKKLPTIIKKVYPGISHFKYFVSEPQKITQKWLLIGSGILISIFPLFFIFIFIFIFKDFFLSLVSLISIALSGILFMLFAPFMPKRTEKGTEAYWHILGFKEYINTAEKYRAEFQEKENIFESYLPFAIIFGLVNKWAKAFEGIYNNPPSWYESDFGSRFTALTFVKSLNKSISDVNNAFSSMRGSGRTSGFGGGGFSGGGRGGGGGGSW